MQPTFLMVFAPFTENSNMEYALQHFKTSKFVLLGLMLTLSIGLSACNDSKDDATHPEPPAKAKLNCAP
ncbi:hypothetical protein [Acinetobacter stercoris]|nr:hypothetical protein [Acinetobacter stercoris]